MMLLGISWIVRLLAVTKRKKIAHLWGGAFSLGHIRNDFNFVRMVLVSGRK